MVLNEVFERKHGEHDGTVLFQLLYSRMNLFYSFIYD